MSSFSLEILLIVANPDIDEPMNTKYLVMTGQDCPRAFPAKEFEDGDFIDTARQMLFKITGVKIQQYQLHQGLLIQTTNDTGEPSIFLQPFGCMLPGRFDKQLEKGLEWLTLMEIMQRGRMSKEEMVALQLMINQI